MHSAAGRGLRLITLLILAPSLTPLAALTAAPAAGATGGKTLSTTDFTCDSSTTVCFISTD